MSGIISEFKIPNISIGLHFIWSESFWLPHGKNWKDIDGPLPCAADFIYSIFAAIAVCSIRVVLCRFVFKPLGLYGGLRNRKARQVEAVQLLEDFYRTNKRPTPGSVLVLAKKLDVSPKMVSNWFRVKRNSVKFPVIVKFTESGWKFTFYLCTFSYGIYCLYEEPFFYDTTKYFDSYPHHAMSPFIFWLYMFELAYYVSGLIWIFLEVRRKDFFVMFTHHVVTVALIAVSYLVNFFRIGSVIMVLHDAADFWLEAAKMLKYLGKFVPCITCLTIFITVWFVTRLYFFPFKVIRSLAFEAPVFVGSVPALRWFLGLLFVLQTLHIFWTIQIIRTAAKPLTTGQLSSDARSDSEMSESDSEQTSIKTNNGCRTNGTTGKTCGNPNLY